MKLVQVFWEDAGARSLGPWVDKQEWKWDAFSVEEVGYVLYEGPEGLIITSAFNVDGQTGPVTQIPAGMIRKIVEIKNGKK